MIVTSGAFMTAFALRLGAGEFALGLLGAAPFVMQMAQAPLSIFVARARSLRLFTALTAGGARIAWIPMAVLLPLIATRDARLAAFVVLFAISSLLATASGTSWTTWMADIVPRQLRGRVFGLRNAVVASVSMGTFYAAGIFMDSTPKGSGDQEMYEALVMVAVGLTAVGLAILYSGASDVRPATASTERGARWWKEPLRNPDMRRLLITFFVWNFVIGIASPFWAAHMIEVLHLDFTEMSYFSIAASAVGFAAPLWWGRLADRYGNRPVLVVCSLSVSTIPMIWLLLTPERLWPLWIDGALSGAFWPGIGLAAFNIVLATAPEQGRAYHVGAVGAASGLGFGLSAILSGVVAERIRSFHLEIAGLQLVHFHVLFVATGVLRAVVAATLVRNLREARSTSTRHMLLAVVPTPVRIATFTRSMLGTAVNAIGHALVPARDEKNLDEEGDGR